ncbi:MAG TPA: hypothetical protein VN446_01560 [Candidatus Acidoferrum sp.]|nr:hypothetical protein [Candidatus Acidoferrum sp.]
MQKREARIYLSVLILWAAAGIWYSFAFTASWHDARLIEWDRYAATLLRGSWGLLAACAVLLTVIRLRHGDAGKLEKQPGSPWVRLWRFAIKKPVTAGDHVTVQFFVFVFLALIGIVWSWRMLAGDPIWRTWNHYLSAAEIFMMTFGLQTVTTMVRIRKIPSENPADVSPTDNRPT